MRLKIETTVHISDFLESLELHFLKRKFLFFILSFLENFLGKKVLISLPENLNCFANFPKIKTILDTLSILQKKGVLKKIEKIRKIYDDEPSAFCYRTFSQISSLKGYRAHGHGRDFFSEEKAMWRAIGEGVERTLWRHQDFFSKTMTKMTYNEVKRSSMNIYDLAGFSEKQKNAVPFLHFTDDTVFAWTPVKDVLENKIVYAPLQLFSALYFHNNVKKTIEDTRYLHKEPLLRWCITTGLATGKTVDEALTAGILEVIERDAFMLTYLNKISPPSFDLEYLAKQDDEIRFIVEKFKRYNLEIHVVSLITDSPVFVNLAFVLDKTGKGPFIGFGASADFDLKRSLLTAITEAHYVRLGVRSIYDRKIDTNNIGREERLIYWAQKKNTSSFDFLLNGEVKYSELKRKSSNETLRYSKEELQILKNYLLKKNLSAYYTELSTHEVRNAGLRTIKVSIPKLQPLHLEESVPYFGGDRIKSVPLEFGYKPAEILNTEPHPFP